MKLSKETITIIKNFGNINSNLTLKPGNVLSTISAGKNIIASAHIPEEFDIEFGIYDVNEFLGVLSLFTEPELTFNDKFVSIKEGSNGVRYFAAQPDILTRVPTTKSFPEPDIEFDLSSSNLNTLLRVASVLRMDDFSIIGNGTDITLVIRDNKNPTGNSFESVVGTTDKVFDVQLKVEDIKLLPGDLVILIKTWCIT